MATIFVLATGPLVERGATVMSGQCLRSWHFAAPLIAAGHRVHLVTVPIPGATKDGVDPPIEEREYRGTPYWRLLSNDPARVLPVLSREIDRVKPDCLIGVNAYPAMLLAQLARLEPFWADLNGWTMAEGQVRAASLGHDHDFAHFWKMEALTLLRADRFSAVSDRQASALYGELAILGRLDRHTVSQDLACCVPNAIYPDYAELARCDKLPSLLAGKVPPGQPYVLWSGGFNSWTDVDTLTAGMARAFAEEPGWHFVCTGGPIVGHDEEPWKKFVALAKERFPEGRCHAAGWIDFSQVLEFHAAAAAGISIDGFNTETRFGARNRLTNMLGAGVPVLTTRGTEIAGWIEDRRAGTVFEPGDALLLSEVLLHAVRSQAAMEQRAIDARRQALYAFAPERTLTRLLRWVESPCVAADRAAAASGPDPAAAMRRHLLRMASGELPFADGGDAARSNPASGEHGGGGEGRSGLWEVLRHLTGGKR